MAAAPKKWNGGRKRLAPGEPTERLTIRIPAGERARLRAIADAMGVTESRAVRELVDREADARGIPK